MRTQRGTKSNRRKPNCAVADFFSAHIRGASDRYIDTFERFLRCLFDELGLSGIANSEAHQCYLVGFRQVLAECESARNPEGKIFEGSLIAPKVSRL
jgi:hypothetical protein